LHFGDSPQGRASKKPVLRIGPEGLLDAAGTIACLCTITGFMGSFWWGFDLTSHFRVQYAVGLIGLAAGLCCCRKFKKALVFAAFAAVNTVVVFPYLSVKGGELRPTERLLRVCLINVRTENQLGSPAARRRFGVYRTGGKWQNATMKITRIETITFHRGIQVHGAVEAERGEATAVVR
jgi:hypothetical protein